MFVVLKLFLDEFGSEFAVIDRWRHRIRNMSDSAQPACFQSQIACRNIHPHSANHDRNVFLIA